MTNERIADHQRNPYKSSSVEHALLPVTDSVYKEKYDYEALDVEPVSKGFRKRYRVVCIPFLTYGINKGDIVTLKRGEIAKRVTDDGQYGYRIAYPTFENPEAAHQHIDPILERLQTEGFETEEFNHKISAVNAMNAQEATRLEAILQSLIREGKILGFDTIR